MKRALFLALVLSLLSLGPVAAQPTPNLYVHAGGVTAQGPDQFSSFYKISPQFGGGIGLAFPSDVEFILAGRYSRFRTDEDGVIRFLENRLGPIPEDQIEVDAAPGSILAAELNIKFSTPLGRRFTFYLSGGIGLYHRDLYDVQARVTDEEDNEVDFSEDPSADSQTDSGINFGLGVSTSISPSVSLFLEPHYNLIFSGQDDVFFIPIYIGASFGL